MVDQLGYPMSGPVLAAVAGGVWLVAAVLFGVGVLVAMSCLAHRRTARRPRGVMGWHLSDDISDPASVSVEDELIEELMGTADYYYTEMTLQQQKYALAAEELESSRSRADWLDTLARLVSGDTAIQLDELILAVVTSGDGPFAVGEITILDAKTLREPFGAHRRAQREWVEFCGHDLSAAVERSRHLE